MVEIYSAFIRKLRNISGDNQALLILLFILSAVIGALVLLTFTYTLLLSIIIVFGSTFLKPLEFALGSYETSDFMYLPFITINVYLLKLSSYCITAGVFIAKLITMLIQKVHHL